MKKINQKETNSLRRPLRKKIKNPKAPGNGEDTPSFQTTAQAVNDNRPLRSRTKRDNSKHNKTQLRYIPSTIKPYAEDMSQI